MRPDFDVNHWVTRLVERYAGSMRRPELLKAIRALSARYVQRRAELPTRSPLDSAGKRAAFAVFYAPLHFLTVRAILARLELDVTRIQSIVDLGCGTGAAGAAWATSLPHAVDLQGVDASEWAVAEANWAWRAAGLRGRARRGDLVGAAGDLARQIARRAEPKDAIGLGLILGWTVNELDADRRAALLPSLLAIGRAGAVVLVVEPVARTVVPWWDDWAAAFVSAGGRADEWRFPADLPPALVDLDEAAGFRREEITARSILLGSLWC